VWKLEQRAKPLFLDMCIRGIPLDQERWERLIGELEDKVVYLKEKVDELAPSHPEKGTCGLVQAAPQKGGASGHTFP
jgi:hypothetical protein